MNNQYTKEEYEATRQRIIEQMKRDGSFGEFFPISLSPFCYNETVAQEYFPLTREEALNRGYRWREKDPKEYQKPVGSDILACIECQKNFRLEHAEVVFYKRYGLPIPSKCPDCRHKARLALRNPRMLFERNCQKCSASLKSTYAPERPETVYCEKCYLETIY